MRGTWLRVWCQRFTQWLGQGERGPQRRSKTASATPRGTHTRAEEEKLQVEEGRQPASCSSAAKRVRVGNSQVLNTKHFFSSYNFLEAQAIVQLL